MVTTFTDTFRYPDGNLQGNGSWQAVGAGAGSGGISYGAALVSGHQVVLVGPGGSGFVGSQVSDSLLPDDWTKPWRIEAILANVGNNSEDMAFYLAPGPPSDGLYGVALFFPAGSMASGTCSVLLASSIETGRPQQLLQIDDVPWNNASPNVFVGQFDGSKISVFLNGAFIGSVAADQPAGTAHVAMFAADFENSPGCTLTLSSFSLHNAALLAEYAFDGVTRQAWTSRTIPGGTEVVDT